MHLLDQGYPKFKYKAFKHKLHTSYDILSLELAAPPQRIHMKHSTRVDRNNHSEW